MAKYTEKLAKQITDLIESDSYTITEICGIVGISKDTFYEWKNTKSDFSDSIKKAQKVFDELIISEAKKSLAKKVKGYEVDEVKTIYADNGSGQPKIREKTVTKKHIQPDTGAIIFTLCNRDSENWKNRQSTELTGKDGKDLIPEIDISKLSIEELKTYHAILEKASEQI